MNKTDLRKAAIDLRKQQSNGDRDKLSHLAACNFFKLDELKTAKTVFCYLASKYEINTDEIIEKLYQKNISVCFPKITGEYNMDAQKITDIENLKDRVFDLSKEFIVNKNEIDICIMPGLAFTLSGHRLGYGKGYYDRYLQDLKCLKIGFCFNFQIIDDILASEFDVNADYLVTDKKIIDCKNKNVLYEISN